MDLFLLTNRYCRRQWELRGACGHEQALWVMCCGPPSLMGRESYALTRGLIHLCNPTVWRAGRLLERWRLDQSREGEGDAGLESKISFVVFSCTSVPARLPGAGPCLPCPWDHGYLLCAGQPSCCLHFIQNCPKLQTCLPMTLNLKEKHSKLNPGSPRARL